ncbi:hypothetical protein MKEN_01027800 [Mycena kentingensis (nom. inval.)]|nr:hypothetical protein MKEN_01027800 [Mycena kentingensis (nom. inval.)]
MTSTTTQPIVDPEIPPLVIPPADAPRPAREAVLRDRNGNEPPAYCPVCFRKLGNKKSRNQHIGCGKCVQVARQLGRIPPAPKEHPDHPGLWLEEIERLRKSVSTLGLPELRRFWLKYKRLHTYHDDSDSEGEESTEEDDGEAEKVERLSAAVMRWRAVPDMSQLHRESRPARRWEQTRPGPLPPSSRYVPYPPRHPRDAPPQRVYPQVTPNAYTRLRHPPSIRPTSSSHGTVAHASPSAYIPPPALESDSPLDECQRQQHQQRRDTRNLTERVHQCYPQALDYAYDSPTALPAPAPLPISSFSSLADALGTTPMASDTDAIPFVSGADFQSADISLEGTPAFSPPSTFFDSDSASAGDLDSPTTSPCVRPSAPYPALPASANDDFESVIANFSKNADAAAGNPYLDAFATEIMAVTCPSGLSAAVLPLPSSNRRDVWANSADGPEATQFVDWTRLASSIQEEAEWEFAAGIELDMRMGENELLPTLSYLCSS